MLILFMKSDVMQSVIMLIVLIPSVVMLNVLCRVFHCYTGCRCAESHLLNVVIMNVLLR
jgi:hypothetical protein